MAHSEYKIGINRLKVCNGVLMSTSQDSYVIKPHMLLRPCLLRLEYLNNEGGTRRRNKSTMREKENLDRGKEPKK